MSYHVFPSEIDFEEEKCIFDHTSDESHGAGTKVFQTRTFVYK